VRYTELIQIGKKRVGRDSHSPVFKGQPGGCKAVSSLA
jgi:hypothetical protein